MLHFWTFFSLCKESEMKKKTGQDSRSATATVASRFVGILTIPQHEVHKLQALSLKKSVAVRNVNQAGTNTIEQILHHFLFFSCFGILPLENLRWINVKITCTFTQMNERRKFLRLIVEVKYQFHQFHQEVVDFLVCLAVKWTKFHCNRVC